MQAKFSNVVLQHKFLVPHYTLTHKSSSLPSREGRSLICMATSSGASLRTMIRTDAPSDQKSLASLTKFPALPAKNLSHERRAKLKPLYANKFRIGSIYKLLAWTIQAFGGAPSWRKTPGQEGNGKA